jgi:hypothetical protein
MKNCIFLFILICFSYSASAQFEASKRKINISAKPDKNLNQKATVPEKVTTSLFPEIKFQSQLPKNPDDKFLKGLPEIPKVGVDQNPKSYALKTPAEDYTEKFNEQLKEDGIRPELYNRDMNLGKFVVYTQKVNLNSRDYGAIDGDLVRVDSKFKEIVLDLEKGMNIIEIEALNYGELSPNTGQFAFYDANKDFITNQYWNLGIGYKARILIEYKEKILKKIDEK